MWNMQSYLYATKAPVSHYYSNKGWDRENGVRITLMLLNADKIESSLPILLQCSFILQAMISTYIPIRTWAWVGLG